MAGTETILAPREDPVEPVTPEVALRALRPLEKEVAKPRKKGLETGFRVLEIDDEGADIAAAGANDEVAADIDENSKKRGAESVRQRAREREMTAEVN